MNLGGACIDQCWNGIFFLFACHSHVYNESFTNFDIGKVWVEGICDFQTVCIYIPFKNLYT